MTDKVTPIRSPKGTFVKGVSGNPHGISAKHQAIKQMQRENEALLTTLIQEMVPHAAKLHRALLKNGKELTAKESIELIKLTYEYGHGKPRQAESAPKPEAEDFDLSDMPEEKREAMIKMLQGTSKGATTK